MKKTLLTAVLTVFVLPQALAQNLVLRIGNDGDYPPFSEMSPDGKMVGFDIDIAHALCAQLKATCQIKQIEWNGLIPALKTHRIDAIIASMSATPEREKSVAFTIPYYHNPGVFLRPKGSHIELTEKGLNGKIIGVLRGSTFDNYATDKFSNWAKIQRYNSQDEANLDAKAGRIDVLFADKLVMNEGFLDRPIGKNFEEFGPEVNDPKYFGDGISIAVRQDDKKLVNELNQAILAIRKNGVYQKIEKKYFDYDIYALKKSANP